MSSYIRKVFHRIHNRDHLIKADQQALQWPLGKTTSGLTTHKRAGGKTYDSIIIIKDRFWMVDRLTKRVYYKPFQVIRDAPALTRVFINLVVQHHNYKFSNLEVCLLLCYVWETERLSTVFRLQRDGQRETQNSIIEDYLQRFISYEQDDKAKPFFIAEKITFNI